MLSTSEYKLSEVKCAGLTPENSSVSILGAVVVEPRLKQKNLRGTS